jgi:lambda family phage portal protein
MIGRTLDRAISVIAPRWALRRAHARKLFERSYQGGENNRLNSNKRPKNQSADQELLGPQGADSLRAWARALVRDNAYAWGVVDTIVSSVVGCGIKAQSTLETPIGEDVENVNEIRDKAWQDWSEVCDVNGLHTFEEMQALCQREIVEAGEVLVKIVRTKSQEFRGITRPVPLALELIEADRLATDKDQYLARNSDQNRIIRGVEIDDLGKPIAYWIYPEHPNSPYVLRRTPERILATEIIHLYRRDRIGQSRGVSWFAPAMQWLRDLGVYVDNELQASAVASCFTMAIKTETPISSLTDPDGGDTSDKSGNQYDYLQPGLIMHLGPNESIESANPGRPNANAGPWIELILRGIAVGTGLSYEVVARDYSKTNYSSSRTSQLEDRRRFRCWQQYLRNHLCQPIWNAFCEQAASAGVVGFPTAVELLDDRNTAAPVEWQMPDWEWVDPSVEQQTAQASIDAYMSDYQTELGARGKSWKNVFYQRAKEDRLRRQLGLLTPAEQQLAMVNANQNPQAQQPPQTGSGEMQGMGRLAFKNATKAITDVLSEMASGAISEARAKVLLSAQGLSEANVQLLIDDARDGSVSQETLQAAEASQ